ncbi:hypothetical protein N7G274_007682 [Stereocaulon virgatum]|uniref:Uncharacterized protein n=1 Tax=Stereocaulon virgatum TaxID=373712 RepID=A0ABR4A0L7_9LECA
MLSNVDNSATQVPTTDRYSINSAGGNLLKLPLQWSRLACVSSVYALWSLDAPERDILIRQPSRRSLQTGEPWKNINFLEEQYLWSAQEFYSRLNSFSNLVEPFTSIRATPSSMQVFQRP